MVTDFVERKRQKAAIKAERARLEREKRRKEERERIRQGDIDVGAQKKRRTYDYLTFRDAIAEYFRATETHGLKRIGWSKQKFAKLIWAILFCISLVGFMIIFGNMLAILLSFPKTIRTTREMSFENFPAVTVCNTNAVRKSAVRNVITDPLRKFVDDAMWNISVTAETSLTIDDPYISERSDFVKVLQKKNYEERLKLGHVDYTDATLQVEPFVVHCAYDGRECDVLKDLHKMWNDYYGNCYVFNGGKKNSKDISEVKVVAGSGPEHGLHLILNTAEKEHMRVITETKGVRVLVHSTFEMPFPDIAGFSVPAGMEAQVGVSIVNTIHLGKPADSCSNDDLNRFNYQYSSVACQQICRQEAIWEHCLCVSPNMPIDAKKKVCTLNDIYSNEYACYGHVMQRFTTGELNCDCPPPCKLDARLFCTFLPPPAGDETSYEAEYSLSKWPVQSSKVDFPWSCQDGPPTCFRKAMWHFCRCDNTELDGSSFNCTQTGGCRPCDLHPNTTTDARCVLDVMEHFQEKKFSCECGSRMDYDRMIVDNMLFPVNKEMMEVRPDKRYTKEDLVSVQVYVTEIGKTTLTEENSYDIDDMLTQIGGISTIFIGASILTFIEFLELIFTLCTIPCYSYPPWPENRKYAGMDSSDESDSESSSAGEEGEGIDVNDRPNTAATMRQVNLRELAEYDAAVNTKPLPDKPEDILDERKPVATD